MSIFHVYPTKKTTQHVYNSEVKFLAGASIRSNEQIAAIIAICSACQWQIEWICEHPGCRPCKQRVSGGLKALIPSSYSRCAAGKW